MRNIQCYVFLAAVNGQFLFYFNSRYSSLEEVSIYYCCIYYLIYAMLSKNFALKLGNNGCLLKV